MLSELQARACTLQGLGCLTSSSGACTGFLQSGYMLAAAQSQTPCACQMCSEPQSQAAFCSLSAQHAVLACCAESRLTRLTQAFQPWLARLPVTVLLPCKATGTLA